MCAEVPPAYNSNYGQPSSAYPAQSGGYSAPTGGYPAPTGGYPAPSGAYPNTQYSAYPGPAVTNQSQSTYANTVVIAQPAHNTVLATTVPDNMGLAIFATFCCFLPLGIFAIMRASESRAQLERGDVSSAMVSANESRRFSLISIGIGILMIIGIIIAVVVVVVNNTTYAYNYYG